MTPFENFEQIVQSQGLDRALDWLADYLIEHDRFHELFEVRKMQVRERLGLPIHDWKTIDELPTETGKRLEEGLLAACSEVGSHLIRHGDLHSGWQYLQPVGDHAEVRKLIHEISLTDDNAEAVIDIAVGHGIDPEFGFQIVLDRFGTCSAITTYESQLAIQGLTVRRGPARLLVHHVYDELSDRVRQCIASSENPLSDDDSLLKMIEANAWLFEGQSHHIDTTHLASTIKIARILEDAHSIDLAIELAEYGVRLHEDFHYVDDPPFSNIYQDTREFLKALRGEEIESTLERMRETARSQIADQQNIDSAQWLVYLLDHVGRGEEATQAYLQWIHPHLKTAMSSGPIAPDLNHLVHKYRNYELAKQVLFDRKDLLGYAAIVSIEQHH